jgi:transposase
MSDKERKLVEPLLPSSRTGCSLKTALYEVINPLRYLVRSDCELRMLSNDFPLCQAVYYWLRRLMRRFLFRTIHDLALMLDRMGDQREVLQLASSIASR